MLAKLETIVSVLFLVLAALLFVGVTFISCKAEVNCTKACRPNPVQECYTDRALCVGPSVIYVAPTK